MRARTSTAAPYGFSRTRPDGRFPTLFVRAVAILVVTSIALVAASARAFDEPPTDRKGTDSRLPDTPEPRLDGADIIELFDGETLDGWVTKGGRYDGTARWTVEDGVITGRQGEGKSGGLLYTAERYRNFVITLETKVDYPFDSGIFLRMAPEGKGAQVTLDYRPGGEVGAIYSDGFLLHNEFAKQSWLRDAWNRFTVRCVGEDMHVTVWMNGQLITDYRIPEGSPGYAPTGLIGVQVHGGEDVPDETAARFRNVRLRELPEVDTARFTVDDRGFLHATDLAKAEGWRPLFDGMSLDGWVPHPSADDYIVRDGMLALPTTPGGGEIRTTEDFRDFELRLDFRIARMANSGLFLRAARDGSNPAYSGCEIQILDDFNWEAVTGSKLAPYQFTGGLYGSVANPHHDAMHALGRWNTYEIRYVGSRLRVVLNGRELYDVDTHDVPGDPPFTKRATTGFIGLQRHAKGSVDGDAYAWFRNLWIRPIQGPSESR